MPNTSTALTYVGPCEGRDAPEDGTIQFNAASTYQTLHDERSVNGNNPSVLKIIFHRSPCVSNNHVHSVHSVYQRHLLHQALRALSNRIINIVHRLLWPTSRQRVGVGVAHPTIVLYRIPRITNLCALVEKVVGIERVRCCVAQTSAIRLIESEFDLRSGSSASTTRRFPRALALGLIGVRISSPSSSPTLPLSSPSLREVTIPNAGFDAPPFSAAPETGGAE